MTEKKFSSILIVVSPRFVRAKDVATSLPTFHMFGNLSSDLEYGGGV